MRIRQIVFAVRGLEEGSGKCRFSERPSRLPLGTINGRRYFRKA
jgi:hypothetical protein